MARVWSCGFELNSPTAGIEWLNSVGAGAAISNSVVRAGAASMQITGLTSTVSKGADNSYSGGSNGPFYHTVWINVATLPTAENAVFAVCNASTNMLYMTLDNAGVFRLYTNAGQITGTSSAITLNTWNRLDLFFNRTPVAGSQVGTGSLNGTVFATSSILTYSLNSDRARIGGNLQAEAQTTGVWYFDDWKINDTNGTAEASWPSDGYIIHMQPAGAGDNTDWTRGGTDSGANWSQVNEVIPNDATNYVTSNTLNAIDDYALTASGIPSGATINMVAVGLRVQGAGASANATFKLRYKAASGGTVLQSGTLNPSNATWRTNRVGATPSVYQLVSYTNPTTTDALTKSDIDASQIGYTITTASTNAVNISATWLAVDYTPSGTPAIAVSSTLALMGVG